MDRTIGQQGIVLTAVWVTMVLSSASTSRPMACHTLLEASVSQITSTPQRGRRNASTVVILDHDGPPWDVGATVARAARAMAALGAQGPLFIRHEKVLSGTTAGSDGATMLADHPQPLAAPASARLAVGFFVQVEPRIEAPFRIERWPATPTVGMRIDGPSWRTPRALRQFAEQVQAAGMCAGPDVIEIMDVDAEGRNVAFLEAALRSDDVSVPAHNPEPDRMSDADLRPAALSGGRGEASSSSKEETVERRSVLTILERIAQGTDPGLWPDFLAPATATRGTAPEGLDGPRLADAAQFAETLLPPGRYSRTRRTGIARMLVAMNDLVTSAEATMPTLSRDIAIVHRALMQQVRRINLDLPEATTTDIRLLLRRDARSEALGDCIYEFNRLTDDITNRRLSPAEARRRWEELRNRMAREIAEPNGIR